MRLPDVQQLRALPCWPQGGPALWVEAESLFPGSRNRNSVNVGPRRCFWLLGAQESGFGDFWKHLRGEEPVGGGGGVRGQSCLAPARSAVPVRPWLSVRLSPLRRFQRQPFARAHRVSAWSHVRARLALGKADTSHRPSEAELNRPPRPRGADQGCVQITIMRWSQ